MTRPRQAAAFATIFLLAGQPAPANPPAPQPSPIIHLGPENTILLDWQGVDGRTYFLQFSLNLNDWFYAPAMAFGLGSHQFGAAADSPRLFLRLRYGDFPGITSLEDAMNADFDGDGLPNIFELTYGYDPLALDSTGAGNDGLLDPDGDGLTNAEEALAGTNPFIMDSDGNGFTDNLVFIFGGDLAAYLASANSSDAFEVYTESN